MTHILSPMPVLRRAVDTLFPPSCPGCMADTVLNGALCADCWSELTLFDNSGCIRCGRPVPGITGPDDELECDECLRSKPVWGHGASVFGYSGTGRQLVLSLKHGDRLFIVPMLAGWAVRRAPELIAKAYLIAPVPLHWSRRLKRRYNQSAELARRISRIAEKPSAFAPELLLRRRKTISQDGLNKAQRTENLRGALQVHHPDLVRDRTVLLIDDVLTTGATLSEAARVLLAAGAASVDILVLALVLREEYSYMLGIKEDEDHG